MFEDIEKKYTVVYPDNPNATYASILNYSTEKDNPFQRWYRYKEGFSITFIEKILEEYGSNNMEVLLDPFAGSGTTILAANRMGLKGIGFEVNPFSFFLMKIKTQQYSESDIKSFFKVSSDIINSLKNGEFETYCLPKLSISSKVFQKQAEVVIMSCREKIMKLPEGKNKDLLFLGWLSCIEALSDYRKAGNGLKRRKSVKPFIVDEHVVIDKLIYQYKIMYDDLMSHLSKNKIINSIYNYSSLDFCNVIEPESIDGIIFSPPYANCFDYTEIYKLELWFGNFVKSYDDLKILRSKSLKSHLNQKYDYECINSDKSTLLNKQLSLIKNAELWDKRIPQMIFGYFEDMFNIIRSCYTSLKEEGFCSIVVGNSAYGGIVLPTDLILAEYAESIGFTVDKIEVDRFIITSSQQYARTKENSKYLRESVICLIK